MEVDFLCGFQVLQLNSSFPELLSGSEDLHRVLQNSISGELVVLSLPLLSLRNLLIANATLNTHYPQGNE